MWSSISILVSCLLMMFSAVCFAGGTYQVGKDGGGIYFQTDRDGGWYIDNSDLKNFKLGQSGTYSTGRDRNGTYLLTDTNQKFYLDIKAKEKEDAETTRINQDYERKMTIMRQQEAKRNKQKELLEAQERQAMANREHEQKMQEQKLEEMERMNQELIKAIKKIPPPVVNQPPAIMSPPIIMSPPTIIIRP